MNPVTFKATFPSIQSAIKVAGDGGMRIQLDIPESELANAVELLAMRNVVLKVTVEIEGKDDNETEQRSIQKRHQRQSEWKTAG